MDRVTAEKKVGGREVAPRSLTVLVPATSEKGEGRVR